MTLLEIKRLCDKMRYHEGAMEHIYNRGELECDDYDELIECRDVLEEARAVILTLVDNVKVL